MKVLELKMSKEDERERSGNVICVDFRFPEQEEIVDRTDEMISVGRSRGRAVLLGRSTYSLVYLVAVGFLLFSIALLLILMVN